MSRWFGRYSITLGFLFVLFALVPTVAVTLILQGRNFDNERYRIAMQNTLVLKDLAYEVSQIPSHVAAALRGVAACDLSATSIQEPLVGCSAVGALLIDHPWLGSLYLFDESWEILAQFPKPADGEEVLFVPGDLQFSAEFSRQNSANLVVAVDFDKENQPVSRTRVWFLLPSGTNSGIVVGAVGSWEGLVRNRINSSRIPNQDVVLFDRNGRPSLWLGDESSRGVGSVGESLLVPLGYNHLGEIQELPIGLGQEAKSKTATSTWRNWLLAGGVFLVGVLAIAWLCVRYLLLPLGRLDGVLRSFDGTGDVLGGEFQRCHFREFRQLERSIVSMGKALSQQLRALRGHIDDLQHLRSFSEQIIRATSLVDLALAIELSVRALTGRNVIAVYLREGQWLRRFRYSGWGEELPQEVVPPQDRESLEATFLQSFGITRRTGLVSHGLFDPETMACQGIVLVQQPHEEDESFSLLLESLGNLASITLSNIEKMEAAIHRTRLQAEVEATRVVQQALMPDAKALEGVGVRSLFRASEAAGGDWYGVFPFRGGKNLAFFVGDVTGHGVSSSIVTGVMAGAVAALEQCLNHSDLIGALDAGADTQLLKFMGDTLNQVVLSTGARCDRFMTLLIVLVDMETGRIHALSAGHTPPYILRSAERRTVGLPSLGTVLGYGERAVFNILTAQLQPGDSIFMYTDGLIDNQTVRGQRLGMRGLFRLLSNLESTDEFIRRLEERLESFNWETGNQDDVALLLFTWQGPCLP